ncbi:unnamed protein product [Orchesella dallaii]|uniref:Uncharacterized protein n=1 Tax=Orchesella dallaii TaxID=48710 RepID=A0ABP1Q8X0_9HEXA
MCQLKGLRVPCSIGLLTIVIFVISFPSSSAEDQKKVLYPDFSCLPGFIDNRGSGGSPTSGALLVEAIEKECGHDKNKDGCNKACVWAKHQILLKNRKQTEYIRSVGDALDMHMEFTKFFKPGSPVISQIVRNITQCLSVLSDLDASKKCPCTDNGWQAVFECFEAAIGCVSQSFGKLLGCFDNKDPANLKARSRSSIRATEHCCDRRIMPCYKYDYEGVQQNVCQLEAPERLEQLKDCCEDRNMISYAPPDPRGNEPELDLCY